MERLIRRFSLVISFWVHRCAMIPQIRSVDERKLTTASEHVCMANSFTFHLHLQMIDT